ncbi:MAG: DUF429 domain-containing protein [Desulfobacterales bacterium]|nr:DUF429 domain-containing protein [Desulfobacterales bacterium]
MRIDGLEDMKFVGVDGCKKGWFAVALGSGRKWEIGIYETIDNLWKAVNSPSLMLIDIPIGLPANSRRLCDRETRKLLGPRGASVFPVPCRNALQAKTYRQACRINQQIMGVKLSIQSWNISSKIKEIDSWLQRKRAARSRIRESHPELCFWSLAGEHIMTHSKKTARGFLERCAILQQNYPETGNIVKQALAQFRRRDLARDDILDALALAVSARISAGKPKTIPLSPSLDEKGRPMEIVYPPAQFF